MTKLKDFDYVSFLQLTSQERIKEFLEKVKEFENPEIKEFAFRVAVEAMTKRLEEDEDVEPELVEFVTEIVKRVYKKRLS